MLLLLVIFLSTVIIGLIIIIMMTIYSKKLHYDRIMKDLLATLDNPVRLDILSIFTPKVWEIYKEVRNNPVSWRSAYCTITNGTDVIWAANDIENRKFYCDNNIALNEHLTKYDKILLDKIVRFIKYQEELVIVKLF